MVGPGGKKERERERDREREGQRESFSFSSAFRIYENLWEGKKLVVSNQ
jgi:hypothetical protein